LDACWLAEHFVCGHIDRTPKRGSQFSTESHQIQKGSPWLKFDKKVDIAVRSRLTASGRAEDPDIPCAVSARHSQELRATLA